MGKKHKSTLDRLTLWVFVVPALLVGGTVVVAEQGQRSMDTARMALLERRQAESATAEFIIVEYDVKDRSESISELRRAASANGLADAGLFGAIRSQALALDAQRTSVRMPTLLVRQGKCARLTGVSEDARFNLSVCAKPLHGYATALDISFYAGSDEARGLRFQSDVVADGARALVCDIGELIPGSGRGVVLALRGTPHL
ncbi:MAG: hypothetical protein AAGB51_07485 [Planctomycetota bacterium]